MPPQPNLALPDLQMPVLPMDFRSNSATPTVFRSVSPERRARARQVIRASQVRRDQGQGSGALGIQHLFHGVFQLLALMELRFRLSSSPTIHHPQKVFQSLSARNANRVGPFLDLGSSLHIPLHIQAFPINNVSPKHSALRIPNLGLQ